MKSPRACLAIAAVWLAGAVSAATPPAQPAPAAKPAAAPAKPAAKAAPAAKPAPAPKKEEPMGRVDGLELARANGGFLGLEIKNSNFVLSFYNAKKKKIAPDVARATLRWPVKYQKLDERVVLNPGGDGTSLTSEKTIRPPHTFKVFMALFVDGQDDAVETYSVDLR